MEMMQLQMQQQACSTNMIRKKKLNKRGINWNKENIKL
jgi:hypothetical protein